jgi:hypothetical protein
VNPSVGGTTGTLPLWTIWGSRVASPRHARTRRQGDVRSRPAAHAAGRTRGAPRRDDGRSRAIPSSPRQSPARWRVQAERSRPPAGPRASASGRQQQCGGMAARCCFDDARVGPACSRPAAARLSKHLAHSGPRLLRLAEQHCSPRAADVEVHRLADSPSDAAVCPARRDRWFSSIAGTRSAVPLTPARLGKAGAAVLPLAMSRSRVFFADRPALPARNSRPACGAISVSGLGGAGGSEPAPPASLVSRRARVGAACRGHLARSSARRCGRLRGGRCGYDRRRMTCRSVSAPLYIGPRAVLRESRTGVDQEEVQA